MAFVAPSWFQASSVTSPLAPTHLVSDLSLLGSQLIPSHISSRVFDGSKLISVLCGRHTFDYVHEGGTLYLHSMQQSTTLVQTVYQRSHVQALRCNWLACLGPGRPQLVVRRRLTMLINDTSSPLVP